MKPKFKISPFINPSGNKVYRVSGMFKGEQRRKNFTTEVEALNCKQAWERELMNLVPLPTITTKLTAAQVDEAEYCYRRLAGHALTLTAAVESAIVGNRPTTRQTPLHQELDPSAPGNPTLASTPHPQQASVSIEIDKLVTGSQLLAALFPPDSRPSLRWLAQMKHDRVIPYYKIGNKVYFDVAKVRKKLEAKNEVRAI
jgi:hypothetical protein